MSAYDKDLKVSYSSRALKAIRDCLEKVVTSESVDSVDVESEAC